MSLVPLKGSLFEVDQNTIIQEYFTDDRYEIITFEHMFGCDWVILNHKFTYHYITHYRGQIASGSNIRVRSVYSKLHETGLQGKQLHTSLRFICTMPIMGWSGVKPTATGLWSSGGVFSGVMTSL